MPSLFTILQDKAIVVSPNNDHLTKYFFKKPSKVLFCKFKVKVFQLLTMQTLHKLCKLDHSQSLSNCTLLRLWFIQENL